MLYYIKHDKGVFTLANDGKAKTSFFYNHGAVIKYEDT